MKIKQLSILLLCTIITSCIHANTLVITRGPVYSGMGGYLSHTLNSLDNSYKIVCQNDIFNFSYYELFEALFPNHMDVISNSIDPENIARAITNYHVYFKDTANEQEQEEALAALVEIRETINQPGNEYIFNSICTTVQHMVIAQLAFHAACGHNVIFVGGLIVNWDNELTSIKQSFTNVIETITYCPPIKMIQEWQRRNERAINNKDATDRHLVSVVLKGFFKCFQPASPDQEGIIILTKDEFNQIIAEAAQYIQTVPENELGVNGIFTRTEFTLDDLADFAQQMHLSFDFDSKDHVILAPSITYNFLLSTKDDCFNFSQSIINSEER